MFKESDGFWYVYYVMAKTSKEAENAAKSGKIHKMLMDTGANYTLGGTLAGIAQQCKCQVD